MLITNFQMAAMGKARTAQKPQDRVQVLPRIIKVAVPAPQHSPIFGHIASSQTELRRRSRRICLIRLTPGPVGGRALMSLRVEKGYGSWGRDYSPASLAEQPTA